MDFKRIINPAYIKTARKAKGLTQEQAAHKLGVSYKTWGAWERGKNDIPYKQYVPIAEALGIELDKLTVEAVESRGDQISGMVRQIIHEECNRINISLLAINDRMTALEAALEEEKKPLIIQRIPSHKKDNDL